MVLEVGLCLQTTSQGSHTRSALRPDRRGLTLHYTDTITTDNNPSSDVLHYVDTLLPYS